MTHDEMIAVIQAHKEGKTVQIRSIHPYISSWSDQVNKNFQPNFQLSEYRVKPEPRECCLTIEEFEMYYDRGLVANPNDPAFVTLREVL